MKIGKTKQNKKQQQQQQQQQQKTTTNKQTNKKHWGIIYPYICLLQDLCQYLKSRKFITYKMTYHFAVCFEDFRGAAVRQVPCIHHLNSTTTTTTTKNKQTTTIIMIIIIITTTTAEKEINYGLKNICKTV